MRRETISKVIHTPFWIETSIKCVLKENGGKKLNEQTKRSRTDKSQKKKCIQKNFSFLSTHTEDDFEIEQKSDIFRND